MGDASYPNPILVAYVLHELLADDAEFLRESSGEHHDLLVLRGEPDDLLDVRTHICKELHIEEKKPKEKTEIFNNVTLPQRTA